MSVTSTINEQPRVGIFWDYENCAPPSGVPGYVVAEQIRKVAHNFGSVTVFRAYLELSSANVTPKVINLRSELQSSGVSLTDCPRTSNRKDVADKMILVDMMAFALDNPAPAVVLLITGDRDFVYAVSILRHRKYTVVLVIPPQGAHIVLKSQANAVLDWRYDVFAEATVEDDTPSTTSGDSSGAASNTVFSSPLKPSVIASPSSEVPLTFTSFTVPKTPPPRASTLPRPPVTPIELAADAKPMTFLNSPVTSPTKPATLFRPHSSSFSMSNRSVSPTQPDPIFVNLIEILEYWRLMGNSKPLRSQLGMELRKRNPLFYQRAGVNSFGEYVTLAEKAKIVVLGNSETPGQDWIQLDKAYQGHIYPVYTS